MKLTNKENNLLIESVENQIKDNKIIIDTYESNLGDFNRVTEVSNFVKFMKDKNKELELVLVKLLS